ncbi:hypothetical protein ACIGO6_33875 [Streptomyces sp. NPDC053750]|uniref:hypothetical protein n=1 Tax=Streptomyces sp. NPDC053750 TaxID=3365714 RepID=UPI0037CEBBC8
MNRARASLALLSALPLLLLSACAEHRPERAPAPPLVAATSPAELALPFDTYKWTPRETWLQDRARRLLAERCLADRGIGLKLPDPGDEPPDVHTNDRRYGVTNVQAAARYGYHLPSMWDEEGGRTRTTGWTRKPSAQEEAALYGEADRPGCYQYADSVLARDVPAADTRWFAGQSAETLERTETDPAVVRARTRWKTCMDEAGHDYAHPREAIGDARWDLDAPTITEREIETAQADIRCMRLSGLLSTWHRAEVTLQRRIIAEHSQKFRDLTIAKHAALRNVLAALE